MPQPSISLASAAAKPTDFATGYAALFILFLSIGIELYIIYDFDASLSIGQVAYINKIYYGLS
jgi:hypothetical protein